MTTATPKRQPRLLPLAMLAFACSSSVSSGYPQLVSACQAASDCSIAGPEFVCVDGGCTQATCLCDDQCPPGLGCQVLGGMIGECVGMSPLTACHSDAGPDGGDRILDGGDAGFDGGNDAGPDAGLDAGTDAGVDAGPDAGRDGGTDAGADAGRDGGSEDGGKDGGIKTKDAGVKDGGEKDGGDDDAG